MGVRFRWGMSAATIGLMAIGLIGCRPSSQPVAAARRCPIPPLGHEKMPGYRPGTVDPTQAAQPIQFISPTLEGNPRAYLGLLQQPIQFCGIAQEPITTVKILASGAYRYEDANADAAAPVRVVGETEVEAGLWFFDYDFPAVGVIDVIAEGYNAEGQQVAKTSAISISLAGPDPR